MNAVLWGLVSASGWGMSDLLARITGRAIGPRNSLFGSLFVGATGLSLWVLGSGMPLTWNAVAFAWVLIAALAVMVGLMLFYVALARGPVSVVAPLLSSSPAFVVLIALFVGIVPTTGQWIAMAAVMAGIWVIARSGRRTASAEPTGASGLPFTVALSLIAAVVFAGGLMLAREAAVTFGELQTVWMIRVSGLGLLLVFLIGARTPPRAPLRWWPALTVQGLTETGALFALYSGMAGEGAGLAAVTAGSSAVITALLGRIFLHEPVPLAQWGGIAIVALGVAALAVLA